MDLSALDGISGGLLLHYRFGNVLLFFILIANPLLAQSNDTTLSGHITDGSGAAVASASITLQQLQGVFQRQISADNKGRFIFKNLPEGQYQVLVKHSGFGDAMRSITLPSNASINLDIALHPAALQQEVTVTAEPSSAVYNPTAQTQSSISSKAYRNTPAFAISEVLSLIPGVTTIQGNGPRDVVISIRGSNERQTYGVRNIKLFEDGFPVTQPDGMGRADLTDPHAYGSIDVVEGPSSALYGNYATGGAINFHTRPGGEIQGVEAGADFGSFGYFNDYVTAGGQGERYQYTVFLSNVRAQQYTEHSAFNTVTGNILATYALRPQDRVTFKFIDNELDADLSIRLSRNQYQTNPYQKRCASLTASGCAAVSVYTNGFNGGKQSLSADQAGLGRHDRRTIAGARWEHDFSSNTTWRTQFVFDDRNINQPTSSSSYTGPYPSFNVISDATHHGLFLGHSSTSYAGAFINTEDINSYTYNLTPAGRATLGGITQTVFGQHLNTGLRAREEITFSPKWTATGGIGFEYTHLTARETNYAYPAGASPIVTLIPADRMFYNVAPEAGLLFRASEAWRLHAHLGTGYGTPQATNLFVTSQGTFGNNTQLKTQRNIGIDVGAEWRRGSSLSASLTGFYEWFHNELVSQSAGINLQSYTFNAPASAHRGVEAGIDWRPFPGAAPGAQFRASYLLDSQIYTDYSERLTSGSQSATFDRNGNSIPGVIPNFLNARVIYDQPVGRFEGLGGFLETNFSDNYQLDNANLLKASGYTLLNLNLHYDPPGGHGRLSRMRFYFEIENLANRTYVGSAGNITNSLNSTTGLEDGALVLANSTGSIYAGTPRASYGGVRMSF